MRGGKGKSKLDTFAQKSGSILTRRDLAKGTLKLFLSTGAYVYTLGWANNQLFSDGNTPVI